MSTALLLFVLEDAPSATICDFVWRDVIRHRHRSRALSLCVETLIYAS